MSILTTVPQQIEPLASTPASLATGGVAWANPTTWTEYFVTSAPTVIAGIVVLSGSIESFSGFHFELAIATGGEFVETEIGAFQYFGPNSGGGGPSNGPQPSYPIGVIPSGTRVSVKVRGNQVESVAIALQYDENYDGDVANIASVTLGGLPQSANMVAITPNAGAWLPSDRAVLADALETDIDAVALLMTTPVPDLDIRWELGKGPAGGEVHVATVASASRSANVGRAWFAELPGMFPFLAGDRVVVRMRKNGTSTTTHHAALMVFRHAPVAVDAEGVIGPLFWLTISFRPPVVRRSDAGVCGLFRA